MIPQRSWTNKQWDTIFISLLAYFIGFKSLHIYYWHPKIDNIQLLVHHGLFTAPYITYMDYVVTITSCFFIQNI